MPTLQKEFYYHIFPWTRISTVWIGVSWFCCEWSNHGLNHFYPLGALLCAWPWFPSLKQVVSWKWKTKLHLYLLHMCWFTTWSESGGQRIQGLMNKFHLCRRRGCYVALDYAFVLLVLCDCEAAKFVTSKERFGISQMKCRLPRQIMSSHE